MENRLRVLGQRDASDPPATLEGATEKLAELKDALRPRVRDGVLVAHGADTLSGGPQGGAFSGDVASPAKRVRRRRGVFGGGFTARCGP